jgi:hypothetical protein
MIFALAEILGLKKFGQAHDLCATSGSIGDAFEGFCEILCGLRSARHLDQGHAKFIRGHAVHSSADQYSIREKESQQVRGQLRPISTASASQ